MRWLVGNARYVELEQRVESLERRVLELTGDPVSPKVKVPGSRLDGRISGWGSTGYYMWDTRPTQEWCIQALFEHLNLEFVTESSTPATLTKRKKT